MGRKCERKYSFFFTYEFHWIGGKERSSVKIFFVPFLLIIFIYLLLVSKMTVMTKK